MDEDPELFFPPGYSGGHVAIVSEAKRVCGGCQVRGPCLDFALSSNMTAGVWGGLTPDERKRLRRRRRTTATAPLTGSATQTAPRQLRRAPGTAEEGDA